MRWTFTEDISMHCDHILYNDLREQSCTDMQAETYQNIISSLVPLEGMSKCLLTE